MIQSQICFACGGEIFIVGTKTRLVKCAACGLGKTLDEIRQNYNSYHRDTVYFDSEKQFKNIFQKRVRLIGKFRKPGTALEIGSSSGLMLSLLKNSGWEVAGIEPSKEACKVSRKRGITPLNKSFENSKFNKETFDLVIMNHVLEHMENPNDILERINGILKKDGMLLVDVPNFESLSAKIWGSNWKYILPQEHKWHFTLKSLSYLLTGTGLKIIYAETHSGVWEYASPAKELFESLTGGKKRFFGEAISAIPNLIVSKLGMGTGLTVLAKK